MARLLTYDQVKYLVNMQDAVDSVEKTFEGFGKGTVLNPTKVTLDLGESGGWPPYEGFFNAMPAYIGWADMAGIKWAGGNVKERKKLGLPYITSMILLMEPKVGNFVAAMDGEYITTMRTGAQTAVALKHMLKGKKSIKLGLYGAGGQGHSQTLAISQVFDIEEVHVYDVFPAAAEKYKADMKDVVKGEIVVCSDPKDACVGDAVVCVTQSKEPIVKNEWVKPGTIVFPMGSYQEADDAFLLGCDKIVVDHIGQCLHRGCLGKLGIEGKITEKDIYATIGEVACGKKDVGDVSKQRITCVPIGTGAMDIAVASVVYKRAVEKNIGGEYKFV